MPSSSSKRKHHGLPSHIYNGDLPPGPCVDPVRDVLPCGELSHRKNTPNGKENITLIEARTSSFGAPAENSCHFETLARATGDGFPAENSQNGRTLNAREKGVKGNTKSAFHAGYGGIHNEKATMSAVKRSNGNHKHSCLRPDCPHHPNEEAEAMSNLKQLNKQLVEQVCSLRAHDSLLHDKLKSLQAQLEENTARGDALLAEKAWFENQKGKFEFDLKASSEAVAQMVLEKAGLLKDNQILRASNLGLERDLSECKDNVRQSGEKMEDLTNALALAGEKVHVLEAQIRVLQLDRQKLAGELAFLQRQKCDLQCCMEEKESLDRELKSRQDTYAIMERQVADDIHMKEALEAELASRSLEREGFQMQLKGAWEQIQSLEAQQEAGMAEKFKLKKQIQELENEIVASCSEHEEAMRILISEKQEKVSIQSLLINAEETSKGLGGEVGALCSELNKLQTEADASQQQIVSPDAQVASLVKEKAALEEAVASLNKELEYLKQRSEEAYLLSKDEISLLREDVRRLEQALAVAKSHTLNEGKCVNDLNSEVKELCTRLKKKRSLAEISIPVAAVSIGSLVIIGTLYAWKRAEFLTV